MAQTPERLDDVRVALTAKEKGVVQDNEDGDEVLRLASQHGFRKNARKNAIFWTLVFCTAGIAWLFSYWYKKRSTEIIYDACNFIDAEYIMVQHIDGTFELCEVEEKGALTRELQQDSGIVLPKLPASQIPLNRRMIVWRHTRLMFESAEEGYAFVPNSSDLTANITNKSTGLSSNRADSLMESYGKNLIDIHVPHWTVLLFRECLHPFFIFQIYSYIVWMSEQYWSFATVILVVAVVSAVISLWELRNNLLDVKRLARFVVPVEVLRDGKSQEILSSELVPGDVVLLSTSQPLPCDLVLLNGQAVLNEAMLTGESTVVIKVPPTSSDTKIQDRHVLFGGTKVVELRIKKDERVCAMVYRTGFSTVKGRLILSILFPKPTPFKFFQEAVKFVFALLAIALIGMVITLWQMIEQKSPFGLLVQRVADTVTIIIPPSLPLAMTVGISYALVALKKNRIFCISPPRVSYAGKINAAVFDKTGTLTNEGLDLKVIRPCGSGSFKDETLNVDELNEHVMAVLASCHTLTHVNGVLMGDPLEVKAFGFSGAALDEPQTVANFDPRFACIARVPPPSSSSGISPRPSASFNLGVLRQFEFIPNLQRMSVLAHHMTHKKTFAYVKGSPEMIRELADPVSIPSNYEAVLNAYALKGFRVLACGYREWNQPLEGMTDGQLRTQSEKNILFLGFLVFENLLKPETIPAIEILKKEAQIRICMATGDNPLTAGCVAKNCGIVERDWDVFMSEVLTNPDGTQYLRWTNTEDPSQELDATTLLPIQYRSRDKRYTLAMTSKAFNLLHGEHRDGNHRYNFHRILMNTSVFARMSPENKAALVEELQALGLYTLMCGDGANDAMALRSAHVGISLSTVEASVAAPFTYLEPNITCVPILLRQGRAALHTSFQLFKFMALYSFIQFITAIIIVFEVSFLSNTQYMWQDFILVFVLALTMGKTEAAERLSVKRPSGRLFSIFNLANTFSHIALVLVFQFTLFLRLHKQPFYDPNYRTPVEDDPMEINAITPDVCNLFLLGNLQDMVVAIIFSRGDKFKKSILSNYTFFSWWIIALVASLLLIFTAETNTYAFFNLYILPYSWRLEVFWWAVLYTVSAFAMDMLFYVVKARYSAYSQNPEKMKPYRKILVQWRKDGAIP